LSAVPLGVAASTNFLAVIVVLPFAVYRYGLEHKFSRSFEMIYWLVVLLFASLGIFSVCWLIVNNFDAVGTQIGTNVVQAAMMDLLGFFGGNALGLGQVWIVIPTIVFSVAAAFSEIDRDEPTNPVNFLLLMLAASALMVFAGFAKPRSFLYLAPVLAVIQTLFMDRLIRSKNFGIALLLTSMILTCSVSAIVNSTNGTHPFKRNLAIPHHSIINFIEQNENGKVLVVSTDPTITWVLRHQRGRPDRCVTYFFETDCLIGVQTYHTIFIIYGHSDRSEDVAFMEGFFNTLKKVTAGRRKVATIHAGTDEDAKLKEWLTGVSLSEFILSVELYR
jgi:hypothetical protein